MRVSAVRRLEMSYLKRSHPSPATGRPQSGLAIASSACGNRDSERGRRVANLSQGSRLVRLVTAVGATVPFRALSVPLPTPSFCTTTPIAAARGANRASVGHGQPMRFVLPAPTSAPTPRGLGRDRCRKPVPALEAVTGNCGRVTQAHTCSAPPRTQILMPARCRHSSR